MNEAVRRGLGWLVVAWGIGGVVALLARAVVRLTPMAWIPIADDLLGPLHVFLYVVWVIWMGWVEGVRGFHQRFSPRVVVRGLYLKDSTRPLEWILAPAFCMGLFGATRRRLIASWAIMIGVIVLVILVGQLGQPWRGIVDGGVVVGLSIGTASIVWYLVQALRGHPPDISPDVA